MFLMALVVWSYLTTSSSPVDLSASSDSSSSLALRLLYWRLFDIAAFLLALFSFAETSNLLARLTSFIYNAQLERAK